MSAPQKEKLGSPSKRIVSRFFFIGAGLVLLAALVCFRFFHEPGQRIILPSGYTLVLREVVIAPETKHVVLGPVWNRWLVHIPARRVPRWLMDRWLQARQSYLRLERRQGFAIVEELLPPADPFKGGGPGSFEHEAVFDEEPLPIRPMGGFSNPYFIVSECNDLPLQGHHFRVRVFTLESGTNRHFLGEFHVTNPNP